MRTQVGKQQEQERRVAAVKDAALRSILSVVACLEAWAAPIREAHQRASAGLNPSAAGSGGAEGSNSNNSNAEGEDAGGGSFSGVRSASPASTHAEGEVERFEAVHSHKTTLAKGIALFNTHPLKGIR